jgi:hypothetical protein
MKINVRVIILIAGFWGISNAYSQPINNHQITINDVIAGSKLLPQKSLVNYIQYTTDSSGNLKNFSSLKSKEYQLLNYKGEKLLFIVQKYQTLKGIDFDTAIVEPLTLKPKEYHSDISTGKIAYKEHAYFGEGKIKVVVQYIDSTVEKGYEFDGNHFLSTTEKTIIQCLPLKIGYEASFNIVNAGIRQANATIHLKVLRKEKLILNHLTVESFVVGYSYNKPPANGTYYSLLWITSKDRQMLKLQAGKKFTETRIF